MRLGREVNAGFPGETKAATPNPTNIVRSRALSIAAGGKKL